MILDAGCGNRAMWETKTIDAIIYCDCEKQLQRKPTIFADNTKLPFTNACFDTIFFDPPHSWGIKNHVFFSFPNTELQQEKYPDYKKKSIPTYYGIDKYSSRSGLVAYLYRAEKELRRVLKDGGCLWLRWTNLSTLTERTLLPIFLETWILATKHEINSIMQRSEKCQSFWFMLIKKPLDFVQTDLMCLSPKESEVTN